MYDIAIVGGGIIGCCLARELAKYELRTVLLEKNPDVGSGATMANSAIIHSGWDPENKSLKAVLNLRGSRMYEAFCRELGVSYQVTSALVAATTEEETRTLQERYTRAVDRGIPATMLTREQAIALEPNLSDAVIAAMELPTTAIINPWETAIACAEEASLNGVEVLTGAEVTAISRSDDGRLEPMDSGSQISRVQASPAEHFLLKTSVGDIRARCVVNCAGVYADKIAAMAEGQADFTVTPRRGEYFVLDKRIQPIVRRVIYPVPSSVGKGILATPTVDGNLLIGPNALDIEDREGVDTTAGGMDYVLSRIGRTVVNIPRDQLIRQFSGLRAKGNGGDFRIGASDSVPGLFHMACMDSPGLSSAPAAAEYLIANCLFPSLIAAPARKESFTHRRPTLRLDQMTPAMREEMLRSDPSFGEIICRCEHISKGEILDVIRRNVGARTVKGVKKRARPGMGRCQGGFCEPRVVAILAEELGVSPLAITYDGPKAYLFAGGTGETEDAKT